jgi:signal transduction histidine kinase
VLEQDPGERLSQSQRPSSALAVPPAAGSVDELEWIEAQLSRLELLRRTLVEPAALARLLLMDLAPLVGAARGAIYLISTNDEPARLLLAASYAAGAGLPESLSLGEGLVGQCAIEQRKLVIRDVPADHFRLQSALGTSLPRELVIVPVRLTENCRAVIELAFFGELAASREALLDRLSERRLDAGADEGVDGPGVPLGEPGMLVPPGPLGSPRSFSNQRSGFWGKLSHELRSPLNSVLVLSKLLSENPEDNLTAKQVAFARAIHASGTDLLGLVNAISDLSKIETNRLVLEPTEMSFDHFRAHVERAFEPVARARDLEFVVELEPDLPASVVTDAKRLRQIMKCLLSNAFKFTENGRVSVKVATSTAGWSPDHERLNNAPAVVAFAVTDTGVGMSESEQRSILDVFPPDRIESRRGSGASGLGMAISRELARLLGGELRVESTVGSGSTFTLYLPTCGLPVAASEVQPALDSQPGLPSAPSSAMLAAASASVAEPSSRRSGVPRSRKRRDGGESSPTELRDLDIMLVDDDVRSAFALTGFLERQGAAVSHAEDLGEAVERLSAGQNASAVLIDAALLPSGSDDLLRQMLKQDEMRTIIVLTRARPSLASSAYVHGSEGDRSDPPALPPQVHQLPKPVDPRQLISLLHGVAERAKFLQSRAP